MAAKFPVTFEIPNDDENNDQKMPGEIAELVLVPFSRIPKLEFVDVEVGSNAVLMVNLRNPTDVHQSVEVILPKDFIERGFTVNADEFQIPPYSKAVLEIHFKPVKALQCRDTIYVGHKLQKQKSLIQLTSRAVPATKKMPRKRKTWNLNMNPVFVPVAENVQILSCPPKPPVTVAQVSSLSVESGGHKSDNPSLNVTFAKEPERIGECSTIFEDSLEMEGSRSVVQEEILTKFSSKSDTFTFDSVVLNPEVNKENVDTPAKKRRVLDMSFSDICFDNLTPEQHKETRSCLRSIENVSHNTSTPIGSVSKVKYTETVTYTHSFITTVKQEPVTPQPQRENRDNPTTRDVSHDVSTQLLNPASSIKSEPVTPKAPSSTNPSASLSQCAGSATLIKPKEEPTTPPVSLPDTQTEFKVPQAVFPQEDSFTPISQSESLRKKAIAFAVSPPNEHLRPRDLFGMIPKCSSTPIDKKPDVLQKARDPSESGQVAPNRTAREAKVPARPRNAGRGTTLSPKSLVAFKRSIRVHVPQRSSSSIPNPSKSGPSTSSQPFAVMDLYTPDFKAPIHNLDLYGATTMSDPFSRCAIHPLEFRDKQGQLLIKWVNSVLTPPEEYSAYEAGVDVATLWKKSVLSNNVPLPPSRESVSSEFHKNEMHLHNLRKTAHLIFKSTQVSQTLYKMFSKIDVGYLSVKDDIDLHSDQGARYHLVQMLMYYNPLWLRIGLEAIYGQDIPLQPRHTVIGLLHFIKNNLLSDKYIAERNSYPNTQLKLPKFKKEINDFIVFKFFSLVFFLDIAKQRAIVPYDPCLFNKNSPIKESEGMVNEFIKEFIKCVGHMKRNLASMGYVVSHKQTAIDEYNFAVQSHLDLRDGASLTRLMEIIFQKKDLIQKLRLPAISRLQKVHNVKLAFSALGDERETIVDVLPTDVVEGHYEKIMSLLWQILHKFLKPRIEKGAVVIQRWWRKISLKVEIERRIRLKQQCRLNKSAVKIQSLWRGYHLRKNFPDIKIDLDRRKEQSRLQKEQNAAVMIQQNQLQEVSSRKIQVWYRRTIAARKQRIEYVVMKKSAVVIQRWYRATVAMKKQKMEYERVRKATVTIQRHYCAMVEGRKQRSEYLLMKKSAVVIQRWYRGTVAMKKQKMEYERVRKATVTIQRWYRATVAMKKQKQVYEMTCKAVVTIQQHYRALVEGRKQRSEYLLVKKSAVVIQRWYRATVAMKNQKQVHETTCKAVVTIQQHYRAMLKGRKERREYLLMKKSAIAIQRWYRATVAMKKQKLVYETTVKAVVTIQQNYRAMVEGRKQRIEYVVMKKSAVVIQRWYRATVAMKKQKMEYERVRKATVTIQQHYRAMVKGRKERSKYLLMKKSAIVIQRWYRATVAMKEQKLVYETTVKAVVTIQQNYRAMVEGRKQRIEYVVMKKSAVVIQRWYRATVAMKKQKMEYESVRKATVTIQQHYRAMVKGRKERSKYLLMKKSAIVIQRWYRATVAMKEQKLVYETTVKAVVTIQQNYRAMVEGRKQRIEYVVVKKSAVVIQRWYRATVAMKKQKMEYERVRKATVTIQQHYRAMVEGRKQRSEYLLMKKSAVVIQRWYRATVVMKKHRMSVMERKSSVYSQHRSLNLDRMKELKLAFIKKTTAATTIQRWYRNVQVKKKARMAELEAAALKIQRWYRHVIIMKRERRTFLSQKRAAIRIQRYFRSYRQRIVAAANKRTIRDDTPTLQETYQRSINFLLSPKVKTSLNWTYVTFKNLDFITLHSPVLCEKLADPAFTQVYALIFHFLDIESRSNAYQSVFSHGMNVLLHLTLYETTYDAVWQNMMIYDGINVLLRLMGKFVEKNEELFCRAATLIWFHSRSPEQLEQIKNTTEFLRRISYYSKKVFAAVKNVEPKKHKPVLPNLTADWGYSSGKGHKEFPSRLDAIVALFQCFKIDF